MYVFNLAVIKDESIPEVQECYFPIQNVLNTECQFIRWVLQQTTIKNYLAIGKKNQISRNRFLGVCLSDKGR